VTNASAAGTPYGSSRLSSSDNRNCWQTTRPILTAPCHYLGVVSNYNWERLRGYEEQILVGNEEVNGTGLVYLKLCYQDPDQSCHLLLPAEDALEFAKLLSRQAHEAMRVKWDEANILSG